MFDNIGGKIKGLASILTWIGIVASVIIGIIFIADGDGGGILIMILGSLTSWLSSLLLYGFGELIENTSTIAQNTSKGKSGTNGSTAQSQKAQELKKLYSQGQLTEEEYRDALENLTILTEEE